MTNRQNTSEVLQPNLFVPHPNLSDEINHNIIQSEIDGGVDLHRLPVGTLLEMETTNRFYELEYRGDAKALIVGHPEFCPEPVLVSISGSTWGRAMLKMHFIGRGMFLEFDHPEFGVIRTSRIQEIRELRPARRPAEPAYGYTR